MAAYLVKYPQEDINLRHLKAQLAEKTVLDPFDRSNIRGHITASAMVVNPHTMQYLMIKHPVYQKWIQAGGHVDPDGLSIMQTAMREVLEETGFTTRLLTGYGEISSLIDIDTHFVGKNDKKNEDYHYHHDFMFLVGVDFSVPRLDCELDESSIKWMGQLQISKLEDFSTRRIARVIGKLTDFNV